MDWLSLALTWLPMLVALLALVFVTVICRMYDPAGAVKKASRDFYKSLKSGRSGLFDYGHVKSFLDANGASYHFWKKFDPIAYTVLRIFTAALFFAGGWSAGGAVLAFLLAVPGFMLVKWTVLYMNKLDNDRMVQQVRTLYNTLQVQISAGISIGDAMSMSYRHFRKGRMRDALFALSSEIFLQGSFMDALDNFQGKFSNGLIDSLCIILRQAQESGRAVDLLKDMSVQIDDMRAASLQRRKGKLDVVVTFCILGVMAASMMLVVYCAFKQMGSMLSSF